MLTRYLCVAIPLAATMSLTGCSDIGISPTIATVRFVNAIPGASLLSFTSSTGLPVNNIQFEGYSSCTSMTSGAVTFTFGGNGTNVPLTTMSPVTLFGGGKYTVLATGNASAPTSLFLADTFSAPPSGSAALRVVNNTSIATNVDVYVGAPNSPLINPSATNVSANGVAYMNVPAQQPLQVWLTATQTTTIVANTSPTAPLTFQNGDEQTLFFIGGTGGSSVLSFTVPNCP